MDRKAVVRKENPKGRDHPLSGTWTTWIAPNVAHVQQRTASSSVLPSALLRARQDIQQNFDWLAARSEQGAQSWFESFEISVSAMTKDGLML